MKLLTAQVGTRAAAPEQDQPKRDEGIDVSHDFIAQLRREHGLKPHRLETFKQSTDADFAAKVADILERYLDPPSSRLPGRLPVSARLRLGT